MRLLFVITNSMLNRGMNTGLENLAWGISETGIEVHILSGGNVPENHSYTIPNNVFYHFINKSGENPANFIFDYQNLTKKYHFDCVIGWIINTALLAKYETNQKVSFFANLGQMPPRSVTLRFLKYVLRGKMKFIELIETVSAIKGYKNKVKLVVSNSNSVDQASRITYGLKSHQCHVIHRGIDTALYSFKLRDHIDDNLIHILYAGNIHKNKGVSDLADAICLLNKKVNLTLCGAGEVDYIKGIESQLVDAGHTFNYSGVQNQNALAQNYRKCDIFIFTSYSEGLPKALLEAMASGCPIICSDIPPHKEIVEDNFNGIIVPVKNPEAISRAILTYINNSSLVKQCSTNARISIENKFSKQYEIDSWIQILNSKPNKALNTIYSEST